MTGDWDISDSRIVISSEALESFSFAIKRTMFENPKWETCYFSNLRASPYLYSAALHYFMRRTTISHF